MLTPQKRWPTFAGFLIRTMHFVLTIWRKWRILTRPNSQTRYRDIVGEAGGENSIFHDELLLEALTRAASSPDTIHIINKIREILTNTTNQLARTNLPLTMLVIGIGSGNMIRMLAREFPGIFITATDIAPEPTQKLKHNPGGLNVLVNPETTTQKLQAKSFSMIVLPAGIARYLNDAERSDLVTEIQRLLRPDGIFLLSEFAHVSEFSNMVQVLEKNNFICKISKKHIHGVFRNSLYYLTWHLYSRFSLWRLTTCWLAKKEKVDSLDILIRTAGYRSGNFYSVAATYPAKA